MILDTSAIIAVITGEDDAEYYLFQMYNAPELFISAATLTETLIVASAKDHLSGGEQFYATSALNLIQDLKVSVVPFTEDMTHIALKAWLRFGKGSHQANLSFGDCLSYAAAQVTGLPLLYKGNDFSLTDISRA
ncbi:MAG: type II toxin-antitoxin system VapC family toxin [Actinomycetaceae bacterium]|nr:type II toxin-antitoxin system VapC family toxin [Arcanobacterium sp.]MDD7505187.1 type II toxin-antitoxin system VapC family toxin [Actinomycetaceae bacterium]MDY6144078.1 type II toxin-antitoxin system VapC family toxin [Arcanobacterium sp.]